MFDYIKCESGSNDFSVGVLMFAIQYNFLINCIISENAVIKTVYEKLHIFYLNNHKLSIAKLQELN